MWHANGTRWEFRAGWMARMAAASVVLSTSPAEDSATQSIDACEDNAVAFILKLKLKRKL